MPNTNTPQLLTGVHNSPMLGQIDINEFCSVQSPIMIDPFQSLKQQLDIPKVEYDVKIYFPKKFEALRRFYCGS